MDRGGARDKYSRFVLMLVLLSAIATGGIVEDSTAVVIGAMIIAPLMTRMLGTALSTITGDGRNTLRSLGIAVAGAALVVAVAVPVTWLAPGARWQSGLQQRRRPRRTFARVAGAGGAMLRQWRRPTQLRAAGETEVGAPGSGPHKS